MKNKTAGLAMANVCGEGAYSDRTVWFAWRSRNLIFRSLKKIALYLKPESKEPSAPDPALAVIERIEAPQLRETVKKLHFLTPPSLKTMKDMCPQCFFLPEDCPYEDYSIPDVNKAIKRIDSHPVFSATPDLVINELVKVNRELARHLREHYDLRNP